MTSKLTPSQIVALRNGYERGGPFLHAPGANVRRMGGAFARCVQRLRDDGLFSPTGKPFYGKISAAGLRALREAVNDWTPELAALDTDGALGADGAGVSPERGEMTRNEAARMIRDFMVFSRA